MGHKNATLLTLKFSDKSLNETFQQLERDGKVWKGLNGTDQGTEYEEDHEEATNRRDARDVTVADC